MNQHRIIAISAADFQRLFPSLLATYGRDLPDGEHVVHTIAGHWDDDEHTRVRAASLADGTITGLPLVDGRIAFAALWPDELIAAWESGSLPEVEELTVGQLAALRPQEEGL